MLTSCATLPANQVANNKNLNWPARQRQLKQITNWQASGAIAINTPEQGQTASMSWQQHNQQNYQIDLFGPLGAGRVTLIGKLNQVTLLDNGKRYQAVTPEALMQQVLGWHLPVANLYFWVRGLPAPQIKAKLKFDQYHHLITLQQQGWIVSYQRYTGVKRYDLPSLLTLKRNNLQVKLVISQWIL